MADANLRFRSVLVCFTFAQRIARAKRYYSPRGVSGEAFIYPRAARRNERSSIERGFRRNSSKGDEGTAARARARDLISAVRYGAPKLHNNIRAIRDRDRGCFARKNLNFQISSALCAPSVKFFMITTNCCIFNVPRTLRALIRTSGRETRGPKGERERERGSAVGKGGSKRRGGRQASSIAT